MQNKDLRVGYVIYLNDEYLLLSHVSDDSKFVDAYTFGYDGKHATEVTLFKSTIYKHAKVFGYNTLVKFKWVHTSLENISNNDVLYGVTTEEGIVQTSEGIKVVTKYLSGYIIILDVVDGNEINTEINKLDAFLH